MIGSAVIRRLRSNRMAKLAVAVACLVLISASTHVAAEPAALATELQVGTAIVDITPPIGYRLSGYFYERLSTAVHDPLYAKAIVLSQGDTRAAIILCDLVGVPAPVVDDARQHAGRETGIPVSHIVIGATHTHTGPLYYGALRTYLHEAAVARDGKDASEAVDYPKALADKLVEAIVRANDVLRPVYLQAAVVRQDPPLSFHRRYYMKDGTVRCNPGYLNPDIVRPCGPIDPDVSLLMIREAGSGKPFASLTVFANHLDTTGGTEYSADYPYYLGLRLKKELGEDHLSVFGQGTSGNINHLDVTKTAEQGRRSAEQIGTMLGETVLTAIPKLETVTSPALAVRGKSIAVPAQQFDDEQVNKARSAMAWYTRSDPAQQEAQPFLAKVEACKIADLRERWGKTIPLEVQVIRLSRDVAIVTLPGEIFVELGLAIKKASPFKTTIVMELCNSSPHYIPTKQGFAEGAYEAVNSRVEPGSGEQLVETAIELLRNLSRAPS